jgi:hypothetical protein
VVVVSAGAAATLCSVFVAAPEVEAAPEGAWLSDESLQAARAATARRISVFFIDNLSFDDQFATDDVESQYAKCMSAV